MKEKLFHLDKNYLLKEAQTSLRKTLLTEFVNRALQQYHILHNPLGLVDTTVAALNQYQLKKDYPAFHNFYQKIAAIYRFKFGDNQLPILWDGRSHVEYYQDEWSAFFEVETNAMFLQPAFLKMILEIAVFGRKGQNQELMIYRLSGFIREHFNMQVYKKKGVVELKIA